VVPFRPGAVTDVVNNVGQTAGSLNQGGGGGGGGGGQPSPAGPSIVSGPGAASTGYATPVVVSHSGQKVTYVNLDNVQHDVNSTKKGPDGRPVFHSKLIGLAESAPVQGAEKVPAGTYEFYC